jgi:serine/threonine protein kinase
MTMTLFELQRWFDAARSVQHVYDEDVRPYLQLALVFLLALFFIAIAYEHLSRICCVDNSWGKTGQRHRPHRNVDKAKVLSAKPRPVESPVLAFTLLHSLGSGDLCDVHYGVSGDDKYVIKIPRTPNGNRLMAKEWKVVNHLTQPSTHDLYCEYFPQAMRSFFVGSRRINAFPWRDGLYTAEQIRAQHNNGLDGRHLAWMFKRTLEALGYTHSKGWIHGAVLPPHLLFHAGSHGLQLIGWIHAERQCRPLDVAPAKFTDWYPPECRRKEPATPSVDIYLAARCMLYLAGGDPLGNRIPNHIPAPIRRFFLGCLLDSPSMRPQDAWDLHNEFTELLEGVYGPPKYQPLEMH